MGEQWSPAFIRSHDWSLPDLQALAKECVTPEEGRAVLDAFFRWSEAHLTDQSRRPALLGEVFGDDALWILENGVLERTAGSQGA